jgi:hypothetical protein
VMNLCEVVHTRFLYCFKPSDRPSRLASEGFAFAAAIIRVGQGRARPQAPFWFANSHCGIGLPSAAPIVLGFPPPRLPLILSGDS